MPIIETFNRAVDSIFNRMGTEALYNNGQDPPFTILVLPKRGSVILELGEGRIHVEDSIFVFRVNEVPTALYGDEIEINSRTYRIEEQPLLDRHQIIWTVETQPF